MYGFLIRKKINVIFNEYVMCMGSHKERKYNVIFNKYVICMDCHKEKNKCNI